jgi:flagellar basal-body rod modification protein FlgD
MVIQPINNPTPFETFAASTAPGANTASSSTNNSAPSQQMFLQLLVAQIKNQDPTTPTDPSQFVAQLAQFSQLEQTIAIRQGVDTINSTATAAAAAAAAAAATAAPAGTTPGA